MFLSSWLAMFTALVFYALIPVAGALVVRKRWRQFRLLVLAADALPELDAAALFAMAGLADGDEQKHLYKAYGEVDAIGPDNVLWIRLAGATCILRLDGVPVYAVRGSEYQRGSVERVAWKSVPSLPQGARVFVAGCLGAQDGRPCFYDHPDQPLLVLLHDGVDEYLLAHALYGGRQQNEYWNPLTQVSLALGILVMSAILTETFASRSLVFVQAMNLSLAFSPVLPLLPPGFIFFFLYRRLWTAARQTRAERDLADLRSDSRRTLLARKAGRLVLASMAAFVAGWLLNFGLFFMVVRSLL